MHFIQVNVRIWFLFARIIAEGALKGMHRSTFKPLTNLEVDYSEDDYDARWTSVANQKDKVMY